MDFCISNFSPLLLVGTLPENAPLLESGKWLPAAFQKASFLIRERCRPIDERNCTVSLQKVSVNSAAFGTKRLRTYSSKVILKEKFKK
jgi:hypothetical protein